MELNVELPYPPTVNTYYRNTVMGGRPRTLISKRGRQYKLDAIKCCAECGVEDKKLLGRLAVLIELYPPDKRKRDIDNTVKAVFDSLTAANVWFDDSQVDRLTIQRMEKVKGGKCVVNILEME